MTERLEALRALRDLGTTAAAATRLRITQSAVSKRITALEEEIGLPLTEPVGRRLCLTAAGERLLTEAEPLLVRLQDALRAAAAPPGSVTLGATDSLWCGWLPFALAELPPGPTLIPHAHRGPLLLDRVRQGALDLAICAATDATDLALTPVGDEPFALVGAGPELWCVEEASLTWAALEGRLRRHHAALQPTRRLESFAALTRLASAGLGRAIVPAAVAQAMGAPATPLAHVARPISIACRPASLELGWMRSLIGALVEVSQRALSVRPDAEPTQVQADLS